MPRLVIVDPAYGSTVGHHGEVNRPLLAQLAEAGWPSELWADVALEAEASAPQPLRGVFSGCGYVAPEHWRDLGGLVQLARRMEQQLRQASAGAEPVGAWLGHTLLPYQLLGLARHLATAPPARVLLSGMFAPGETLQGPAGDGAATDSCRVALAALARAVEQQGHGLLLAFPSAQQEALFQPLLAAVGLESAGVHPAVVGAGCRPPPPPAGAPPMVLLHWGDRKAGKGREQALAVLEALLEQGAPGPLAGWGWLFHGHSRDTLGGAETQLLQRAAAADIGLHWLQGEVESAAMQRWLAQCPLALLAYDPDHYRQRSSGVVWQWAACRQALGLGGAGVGHGTGWLAVEARALGLGWRVPAGADGAAWLGALATAAAAVPGGELSAYGLSVLGESFAAWCVRALGGGPAAAGDSLC